MGIFVKEETEQGTIPGDPGQGRERVQHMQLNKERGDWGWGFAVLALVPPRALRGRTRCPLAVPSTLAVAEDGEHRPAAASPGTRLLSKRPRELSSGWHGTANRTANRKC